MDDLIGFLYEIDPETLSKATFHDLMKKLMRRRVGSLVWGPVVECNHYVLYEIIYCSMSQLQFCFQLFPGADAVEPIITQKPTDILLDEQFKTDKSIFMTYASDESYIFIVKDLIKPSNISHYTHLEVEMPMKITETNFNLKVRAFESSEKYELNLFLVDRNLLKFKMNIVNFISVTSQL